jgi:hypothetical protein
MRVKAPGVGEESVKEGAIGGSMALAVAIAEEVDEAFEMWGRQQTRMTAARRRNIHLDIRGLPRNDEFKQLVRWWDL